MVITPTDRRWLSAPEVTVVRVVAAVELPTVCVTEFVTVRPDMVATVLVGVVPMRVVSTTFCVAAGVAKEYPSLAHATEFSCS
jgi:hypothetical protein